MKRFLIVLIGATLAGLFSVYAEVEAVKIGYRIRKQEEMRTQFLDRARALKYNIARFEAPHVLEKRLAAQRIALQSPKSWETLVLGGARSVKTATAPIEARPFFAKLWIGTAHAEAKESRST